MAGQHAVLTQQFLAVCPVTCLTEEDKDGFPRRVWVGLMLTSNLQERGKC